MNKRLVNLAQTIFLMTIVLAIISCNTRNTEKEYTGNIILDVKTDSFEYKVYENHSKVNSDNIDQCEKFFSYNSTIDGFEMYGTDISDLYAYFSNINRNNVDLKNKNAIFYTVIYTGKQNDSVKNEIINHLLDKRNLQVSENSSEVNIFNINVGNSNKIEKYINKSNLDSGIRLTDNHYELTNANLKILATALNELYPNTFFYEGNENIKYDLKIPLGKDVNSMVDYLSKNYGIDSNPSVKNILSYEIKDKL